jgi:hypothetical protein
MDLEYRDASDLEDRIARNSLEYLVEREGTAARA